MTQQAQQEQLAREAEAHRRIAEVLANKEFMAGVYRAMTDTEPPVEWKDLKRK
jgi:hypothetical protein